MSYRFEPVTLAENYGDDEAVLVFRDGSLLAVASRLGKDHGALAGRWYVEKSFARSGGCLDLTFADHGALESWLATRVAP